VFAAMFEHHLQEESTATVKIVDVSGQVMRELLRYLYVGELNEQFQQFINMHDNSLEMLRAADKYCMPDLKLFCERAALRIMTVENVITLLTFAKVQQAPRLKAGCIAFVCEHLSVVNERDEFLEFSAQHPDLVKEIFAEVATSRKFKRKPKKPAKLAQDGSGEDSGDKKGKRRRKDRDEDNNKPQTQSPFLSLLGA
jgi:hypothetical protein